MKIIYMIIINVFVLTLFGCQNTVQGFGKDMQKSGQEIEKAAS